MFTFQETLTLSTVRATILKKIALSNLEPTPTKEEVQSLTDEQLLKLLKLHQPVHALSDNPPPAEKPTKAINWTKFLLQHPLNDRNNWILWKRELHQNLVAIDQALWLKESDRPSTSVPILVFVNNIKLMNIRTKLSTMTSSIDAWEMLTIEFESATVMNAAQVADQLINASIQKADRNVLNKLDRHRRLVQTLISFLPTKEPSSIMAVCNIIFYAQLQHFQCLSEFNLTSAVDLDLDQLELSLKGELYSTNLKSTPTPAPSGNKTTASCSHDKKFMKEGKCRMCHPCQSCTAKQLRYTFHVQTADCDQNNPPKPKANQVETASQPTANLANSTSVLFTVDSGCSDTMVSNKDIMNLYHHCEFDHLTLAGGDHTLPIQGAGTIDVHTDRGPATLRNVFHAPDLSQNLLSVSRMDDNGYSSVFCDGFHLFPKKTLQDFIDQHVSARILAGERKGNLYQTELTIRREQSTEEPTALYTGRGSRTLYEWHLALNHMNYPALLKMSTMIDGMKITDKLQRHCDACHLSKANAIAHPNQINRTFSRIGEQVNADWIEGLTTGIKGEQYSLHFYDRFSNKSFVYNLKSKTEIQQACIALCEHFKTHTGRPIGLLMFDQGSNFTANELVQYCTQEGIKLEFSPTDNPSYNPTAERLHRTLKDSTRTILTQTGLPIRLWPYAIEYANYVRNVCPVSGKDQVPDHIWYGRKPHISHVQPFGIPCFPKYPTKDIKKHDPFDPRATSAIFAGYDDRIRGYRCLDVDNYQLIICPDVTFNRDFTFPKVEVSRFSERDIEDDAALDNTDSTYTPSETDSDSESSDEEQGQDDEPLFQPVESDEEPGQDEEPLFQPVEEIAAANHPPTINMDVTPTTSTQLHHDNRLGKFTYQTLETPAPKDITNPPKNSKRRLHPPRSYLTQIRESGELPTAYVTVAKQWAKNPAAFVSQLLQPPSHFKDIAGRPDEAAWMGATDSEVTGLRSKGFIRELVPRSTVPKDTLIYKSRFVFSRKSTGKAKARWVIRGDMRKRHEKRFPDQYRDTKSTYAPVAENASFKVLCSIVAHENMEFEQSDVDQAFLNAKHPGVVYVEQPEGYKEEGKEDWIILLDIGVYGLPESPILWNEELDTTLRSMDFHPSPADPCLYTKLTSNGYFYVLVYVDDLVMAHADMAPISELKQLLHKKYGIKDLGPVNRFTSYQVTRNRSKRTIILHQHDYINELLQLTQMQNCIPIASLPVSLNFLNKTQCPTTPADKYEMEKVPYRQTVGALLHIANRTRPDICHAVSVLTRYNHNPGKPHWHAVKSVLRFLKHTSFDGLELGGTEPLTLRAYVDANFAQDPDSRKSTSGYIFLFGSAAVSYKSSLQKAVTTSSTEAEIGALFISSTEAIWLRRLLTSMGYQPTGPTIIYEDNQAAIKFIRSKETHGKLKHIDIKHLFLREKIDDKDISLQFIPSKDNPADITTKSLPKTLFQRHRRVIGLNQTSIE
jgi:transposase InsO family protein